MHESGTFREVPASASAFASASAPAPTPLPVAVRYRPQDEAGLGRTLAGISAVSALLGGTPPAWSIKEIGDGNLNLVFVVRGPTGGVVVKQALPYVRMVGESWPLPLSRSHFEHAALLEHGRLCSPMVPAILHRDDDLALIVMELLEPHIIMRRGMIAGAVYPRFAETAATFLARTLFLTSDLALSAFAKKARLAAFAGNTAMCKITEDLIFTEPYFAAPHNRWTSPQLDGVAASLRADIELKLAAMRLKVAFLSRAEAMLHGDLHTGAIMVTATDTRVIDAEFAFYGPMGFDTGILLGNLLLNACCQRGHEQRPGERGAYVRWILQTMQEVWTLFHAKFLALWRESPAGDAYAAALFDDAESRARLDLERHAYLGRVLRDTVGFAGLEMIRRCVGLSHVIDLERIADPARRSECEKQAIAIGRELVVNAAKYDSIRAVAELAASVILE